MGIEIIHPFQVNHQNNKLISHLLYIRIGYDDRPILQKIKFSFRNNIHNKGFDKTENVDNVDKLIIFAIFPRLILCSV